MDQPAPTDPWASFFARYGPRLLLFARQQCRSEADAQDILQEALVRVWRRQGASAEKPDESALPDLLGLLFAAIRRAAIDLARSRQRRAHREDLATRHHSDPVDPFVHALEADERDADLRAAVRNLPPPQQEVLVLKIWGEQTFEAIGSTLGVSPNTAASRYRYALEALRRQLGAETAS
ncbi:MAG: RNA polymerase sigma factor [Opitutales bacterium]